ncbi:hypothetical protein Tco_1106406 [Tanacetum coccineum]
MACSLPHTDFEVEALVQRLINEDKGRQEVLLNLAFQFEDSCAVRDDLRKAYEKCNDISRESRALICTLLKESSEKDRKLHLSMYGKATQLEKQMGAKSAWFQEKYSGRTHGGIGCSSSQTNCPLTEKELHQLRMDEEAQKGMLEEEAMNKKVQEEKIRQEQAENDAFFLEFGVVRYDSECLGGLEFSEFVHDPQHVWPRSSSLAVTSSGLSSDVSDAGLPLEKVMTSGKNGDGGDLLLFREGPGIWIALEVGESSLLGMECPVAASCFGELSGRTAVTAATTCHGSLRVIWNSGDFPCPNLELTARGGSSHVVLVCPVAMSSNEPQGRVEALVQRLINEDKGRQDVLLNLAFQFEDSCAVRDDLRKAYEKCNDISQESRALICTLLKESSEKDRKLHLSMYGKAAQLQKQMDAKSAWFQEKYSGRTHGGIGCSSSQTDFPLTEKELHQLRMDEEALKEMLEEEAMNKKAQEEKIRQEQAENDAFFLEFGVVRYDSDCESSD